MRKLGEELKLKTEKALAEREWLTGNHDFFG